MTTTQTSLSAHVQIRGRFYRSVNLALDWRRHVDHAGYVMTPTAEQIARRIIEELQRDRGIRCWSVTGPYGSGKSAFALFLTDLLARAEGPNSQIDEWRSELAAGDHPLLPILIVGKRAPLIPALLEALADSVEGVDSSLCATARALAGADRPDDGVVTQLFGQVVKAAKAAGFGGVLMIVDEFGKFLEHASLNPKEEDLYILQSLAENASRSAEPFLVMTILHTAFVDYLGRADTARQAEWMKIQGRFQDVAFLEPAEQMFRLVSMAIETKFPKTLNDAYDKALSQTLHKENGVFAEADRRFGFGELAVQCVPLHPITLLLLWPVFRSKLAQNERSLFSFLTSAEPMSFQAVIRDATCEDHSPFFYRIDHLYDYVTSALGAAILRGESARRWGEIDGSLERLPADAPAEASSTLKAIGLLSIYGSAVGLRADKTTLGLALGSARKVWRAVDFLEKNNIIIFRKHQLAYGLWEGSDINLDERYEEGLHQVGFGDPAQRLSELVELRKIVARGHYVDTGTLRAFDVEIFNGDDEVLLEVIDELRHRKDGRIAYFLCDSAAQHNALVSRAMALTKDQQELSPLQLLAFPEPIHGLQAALKEVEAWRWVSESTAEMSGDPVARREVQSRLEHAQQALEDLAGETFGLNGYLFHPGHSIWVADGEELGPFDDQRAFLQELSYRCDRAFEQAPALHNELLNRQQLSSAATAARNGLLRAMLNSSHEENLGFSGTPPEVSMYRTMLVQGGFHVNTPTGWRFQPPTKSNWSGAWDSLQKFLDSTEEGRRPVQDLYDELEAPPLGIRRGPMPVLLLAGLLVKGDTVALYKDGIFVPEVRDEILELLARNPANFEIQQYSLSSERQAVLTVLREVMEEAHLETFSNGDSRFLQIVRPLVIFAARLPQFTKVTQRLSKRAISLREALLSAQDPSLLLFQSLSAAIGVEAADNPAEFRTRMTACLAEMAEAYPRLLDRIEGAFRTAFDLPNTTAEARECLRELTMPLRGLLPVSKVSHFVAAAARLDQEDWREALARTLLDGAHPKKWTDAHWIEFENHLRTIRSDFIRHQSLVAELQETGYQEVFRVSWLIKGRGKIREVLAVPTGEGRSVEALVKQLAETLRRDAKMTGATSRRAQLAAVAKLAATLIEEDAVYNDD